MDIRVIPIDQINPATYNPRIDLLRGDPEYEKLWRSIESFGYVEPIVWNERTGNMVGGHQRYKIMVHEQGCTELAVSVVDLDHQQERLLNLALNKVSGRWDEEALAALLDECRRLVRMSFSLGSNMMKLRTSLLAARRSGCRGAGC